MAHGHDQHDGHGSEEHVVHHSHAKLYIQIFVFLLVVTGVEVAIPQLHFLPKVPEVLLLLTLMTIKGAFVMMFYMHLKMDHRFFTLLFGGPLLLATGVMFGLLFLFGVLTLGR